MEDTAEGASPLDTFAEDFLDFDPEEPPDAEEVKRLYDAVKFMEETAENFKSGHETWTLQNIAAKFDEAVQRLNNYDDTDDLPVNEHFAITTLPFIAEKVVGQLNKKLSKTQKMDMRSMDQYIMGFARYMDPDRFAMGRWRMYNLIDILDYAAVEMFSKQLTTEDERFLKTIAHAYIAGVQRNKGEEGVPTEIVKNKFDHMVRVIMGEYPHGFDRVGESSTLAIPLDFLLDPKLGDIPDRKKISQANMKYLQRVALSRRTILSQSSEEFSEADKELMSYLEAVEKEGYLHFGYTVEEAPEPEQLPEEEAMDADLVDPAKQEDEF